MSFADELRNEPNRHKQEQTMRVKENWNTMASELHEIIKNICKEVARENQNTLRLDLRRLIEEFFEEPYTYEDSYYEDGEDIYELTFENSKKGQFWEEMRKYFYHYWLGRKSKSDQLPKAFGMFQNDATLLQNVLLPMLEKDGLQVNMNIKKANTTYREEQVYVEYSSLDRIFSGKDGYMKTKRVEDKILYTILINLSW